MNSRIALIDHLEGEGKKTPTPAVVSFIPHDAGYTLTAHPTLTPHNPDSSPARLPRQAALAAAYDRQRIHIKNSCTIYE